MVRIALKDLDSSKASYWELWPCQLWASSCHQGCSKPVKNAKYATNVRIIYKKKKKKRQLGTIAACVIGYFPEQFQSFIWPWQRFHQQAAPLPLGAMGLEKNSALFFLLTSMIHAHLSSQLGCTIA